MKRLIVATMIGALGVSAAYAASGEDQLPASPDLDVSNVKIEGNVVSGFSVDMDKPGYVVIHDNGAGAAPNNLGHIKVHEGKNTNVRIEATGDIDPANEPTLMVHYETNDNDTYDFGPGSTDVDTPAMTADGPVIEKIGGM